MAGQDRRFNQKTRKGAIAHTSGKTIGLLGILSAMFGGVSKMAENLPAPKIKLGNKYKPHQGAQEKARRVRQGNAPLNMNVVAKPSQDFSKSHWNNAQMRKAVEANNAS